MSLQFYTAIKHVVLTASVDLGQVGKDLDQRKTIVFLFMKRAYNESAQGVLYLLKEVPIRFQTHFSVVE